MRTSTFAALYFFALGWYARASGLDRDAWKVLCDGYDLAVLHTLQVARRARAVEGAGEREEVPA